MVCTLLLAWCWHVVKTAKHDLPFTPTIHHYNALTNVQQIRDNRWYAFDARLKLQYLQRTTVAEPVGV